MKGGGGRCRRGLRERERRREGVCVNCEGRGSVCVEDIDDVLIIIIVS